MKTNQSNQRDFASLQIKIPPRKLTFLPPLMLLVAGLLVLLSASGLAQAQGPGVVFEDSGQRLGNRAALVAALGDIDGDGDLDALVGNEYSTNGEVWRNNGQGFFSDTGQNLGPTQITDIALGDLNGDGDLDAVVVSDYGYQDYVYVNNGSGSFSVGQNLDADGTSAVELGDIDNDGDLDAIVLSYNQHKVWRNNGGTLVDTGQSLGGGNAASDGRDVKLGDLDGDGDLDLVIAYTGFFNSFGRVWRNNGSGTFSQGQELARNGFFGSFAQFGGAGVALLDYDGDGDLDIAKFGIWQNNGSATFTQATSGPLFSDQGTGLAVGDIDRDGDPDVLDSGPGGVTITLNEGIGNTGTGYYGLPATSGNRAALGDLNGDGTLDVFLPNGANVPPPPGPNQVWFNRTPQPDSPPVAVDDYFVAETSGGTTVTDSFHLFENDYDPDGDPLVLESFTQPTYGSVQNPSGDLIIYTRTGGGPPDSFTYTLVNSAGRPAEVGALASASAWFMPDCGCVINCLGGARLGATQGRSLDLSLIYRLRDQVMKSTVSGNRYVDMYYHTTPEIAKILMLDRTDLGNEAVTVVELWQSNLSSLVDGDGSAVITQAQVDAIKTFLTNLSAAGSANLQQRISTELTNLGPLDDYVGLTMAEAAEMILTDETIYLPVIVK